MEEGKYLRYLTEEDWLVAEVTARTGCRTGGPPSTSNSSARNSTIVPGCPGRDGYALEDAEGNFQRSYTTEEVPLAAEHAMRIIEGVFSEEYPTSLRLTLS